MRGGAIQGQNGFICSCIVDGIRQPAKRAEERLTTVASMRQAVDVDSGRVSRLIAFNKPYGVLTQFRPSAHGPTLADYVRVPGVYPAGRLDKDSEGLLLLTDDGALQHRLSDPRHKLPKTYWVQVEGVPAEEALKRLRRGVVLEGRRTRPAKVRRLLEPALWPRDPRFAFASTSRRAGSR